MRSFGLYIDKVAPFIAFSLIFVCFREVRINRSRTRDKFWTACSAVVPSVDNISRICSWWWCWGWCRSRPRRYRRRRGICGRGRPARIRGCRSISYTTWSSHRLPTWRRIAVHHDTWHGCYTKLVVNVAKELSLLFSLDELIMSIETGRCRKSLLGHSRCKWNAHS